MKRSIALLLILSGCTSNNYLPDDSGMDDALSACRHTVMSKAASEHDHLGALIGGGVGGVGGGIVGGAIEGSEDKSKNKDWNFEIEKCMASKGYSGVSSGYN